MNHRLMTVLTAIAALLTGFASTALPAAACAGLIGSNGAVNLGRTTTLAAYHDGIEHYVTAFQFLGGGGQFGTLIPLPGVPSNVEKGGSWTLQRLVRETQPIRALGRADALQAPAAAGAEVLMTAKVDALDLTVLKGGAHDVADWAIAHGFSLSPDAPEMLDFYAKRSPIFLAAVFDGDEAASRGQQIGDGTPVQITIPTTNPWVPLRILGLGKQQSDRIEADVFLLTDRQPSLLPETSRSMSLFHNQQARVQLLDDLRGDEKMDWIPQSGWLTQLRIDSSPHDLSFDLAVDASGQGTPSRWAAGLDPQNHPISFQFESFGAAGLAALLVLLLPVSIVLRRLGVAR